MRHFSLPVAIVLAAMLGLVVAAPAAAATTGTICGEVTAFTAPTALADGDGEITIDGQTEIIDQSAFGVVDASVWLILTALATADATTCLDITADTDGNIVDISVAAQAEICGEVALDTTSGLYTVAGVTIPGALVGADADLEALLDAAVAGDASVCLDVSISPTTGLLTSVSLSATIDLCGEVSLDADSATIAGADVPFTLLDAEAIAALQIAAEAGVDACVALVVDDTALVQANVSADVTLCGEVTLDAEGNAVVDGVTIDADLLSAGAAALLELAASADGEACVDVAAVSSNGNTSVAISVSVDVCAEVTAVGDGTITLGDVTLILAAAGDAGIEVGDMVCVTAVTGPTGQPTIRDVDTVNGAPLPGDEDEGPAAGDGDDDGPTTLPDTATGTPVDLVGIGFGLLGAAVLSRFAMRRWDVRLAR